MQHNLNTMVAFYERKLAEARELRTLARDARNTNRPQLMHARYRDARTILRDLANKSIPAQCNCNQCQEYRDAVAERKATS